MASIKHLWLMLCLILFITACGSESAPSIAGSASDNLAVSAATDDKPLEDRRIAIVHSQASKKNFYDQFAYNQLYAAMQNQAVMAGIPFDLLSESDLTNSAVLLKYDALLLPAFSHVQGENRVAIKNSLLQAQQAGVAIVTSGGLMTANAEGRAFRDATSVMAQVLGVTTVEYVSGVAATVNVSNVNHPITQSYTSGEELTSYDQIWFGSFAPANGEQSTVLTKVVGTEGTHSGLQIIERAGPVVHFASEQIMADNNLLWRVLQWVVFEDMAPVSLQFTRNDSVFIARNDMDEAMKAAELSNTEIPLLDIIKDWKRDYNFVGSYYIDLGNEPDNGLYTDWRVSGPLYKQYIALGSEIGTHSWTHPYFTKDLSDRQLEFEFNQSKNKIGSELGIDVVGGAVPGTAEDLNVVENLNKWFKYFSGRSGVVGSGYPGAIGFLEPQHDMLYFSLNMSPDFTLIEYLNKTTDEALDVWRSEIDQLLTHATKPVIHWLWHDYGPTTAAATGLYSVEMFQETIAYAKSAGTEFTTLSDLHDRIRSFQATNLSVGVSETIDVTIDSTDLGQFALKLGGSKKIKSVANWYAYDDTQVFLPDTAGSYSILTGAMPDAVTRITKLPMRARLVSLNGDGQNLEFVIRGEGEVTVVLNPGMANVAQITGADSFTESQGVLTLRFNDAGMHRVAIQKAAVAPQANRAPVATPITMQAITQVATPLQLAGFDADNDTLTFKIVSKPQRGELVLSGSSLKLSYIADVGFSGVDSFAYIASDGVLDSAVAIAKISVVAPDTKFPNVIKVSPDTTVGSVP